MKSCPCRLFLLLMGCLLFGLAALPAAAQEALFDTTSLRFVPAEADQYLAAHHLAEVTRSLFESQAMARLDEVLQDELGDDYRAGFTLQSFVDGLDYDDTELIALFNWLGDPANRAQIELGQDMLSHEVFYYRVGGEGNRNAEEYWTVDNLIALAKLGFSEDSALRHREILAEVLAAQAQSDTAIAIPQTVAGFRVSDPQQALEQLDWVEALLRKWMAQELPELNDAISQEQIGPGRYVLLRIEGENIPWENLITEQLNSDPERHAESLERLRTLEGVLGIGVIEDYVLVFLLPGVEALPGQGGELLWNDERLAALREAELTAEELFTIRYRSEEGTPPLDRAERQQDRVEMVQSLLEIVHIDPLVFDTLVRPELEEFFFDLRFLDCEPGPVLGFTYFTPAGLEGYTVNWGESPYPRDGRTLDILPHTGGEPLVLIARRQAITERGYNVLAKWNARLREHLQKALYDDADDERQRQEYEEEWEVMVRACEEIDRATRDSLLPALGDGQIAWILDNDLRAGVLRPDLPEPFNQTRMIEPALVLSVEDRAALLAAGAVYRETTNHFVEENVEISLAYNTPDDRKIYDPPYGEEYEDIVGGAPLAAASVFPLAHTPQGDIYRLFSNFSPNDRAIAFHFGVGENVLTIAGTQQHTQRLLTETPWLAPLYERDQHQAVVAVTHYDFAGIVNTMRQWRLAKLENADLAAMGVLGLERSIPTPVLLPVPNAEPPGLQPLQELELPPQRALPNTTEPALHEVPAEEEEAPPVEIELTYPTQPAVPEYTPAMEEAYREELAELDPESLEEPNEESEPQAPSEYPELRPLEAYDFNYYEQPMVESAPAGGVYRLPRSEELEMLEPEAPVDEAAERAARIERIHYACDLLECLEGYTSVTWHEEEALVTHYELRYHDLPAE